MFHFTKKWGTKSVIAQKKILLLGDIVIIITGVFHQMLLSCTNGSDFTHSILYV